MLNRRSIGLLREVKNKWERRAPISPADVQQLVKKGVEVFVQPSTHRIYRNKEYEEAGAFITEDLSKANCIFGVKEFPYQNLIPNKAYIMFSHVIKAQPYNMPFLDACLQQNIRLFDYETIRSKKTNERLVFFGRFAGNAGLIDTLRGLGERLLSLGFSTPFMHVASSYMYPSLEAAKQSIREVGQKIKEQGLPQEMAPFVFTFTGTGNVSQGARDIFELLPHKYVKPEDLPHLEPNPHILYGCVVTAEHMVELSSGDKSQPFDKDHYYANPHLYKPVFHEKIAPYTSVLINGMYWSAQFPRLITNEQMKQLEHQRGWLENGQRTRKMLAVGDISCDIEGSLEFLKRNCTIDQPFFMYDAQTDSMNELIEGPGVLMMGIENLPAEFPREASGFFSQSLAPFIEPLATVTPDKNFEQLQRELPDELKNALITCDNKLTPNFEYISNLRKQKEREAKYHAAQTQEPHPFSNTLLLEGHLFDTGFINAALDLFESKTADFRVEHWDISPNRQQRHNNFSKAVVTLFADSKQELDECLQQLSLLATRMPAAKAHFEPLTQQQLKAKFPSKQLQTTPKTTLTTTTKSDQPMVQQAQKTTSFVRPTNPKRVLLFGSGYVTLPVVDYLTQPHDKATVSSATKLTQQQQDLIDAAVDSFEPCHVTIVTQRSQKAEAEKVAANNEMVDIVYLDVAKEQDKLGALIAGYDLVISLVPAALHPILAAEALKQGKDFLTASYISPKLKEMNDAAKEKGLMFLNEAGLDPGIDHMSAMRVIHEAQEKGLVVSGFESVCGGLPSPDAAVSSPLMYKFSWYPLGVLLAAQNSATYLQDGKLVNIPGDQLLASARPFHFPPNLPSLPFSLEGIPNRDSLQYTSVYGLDKPADALKSMFRGTLRYAGFCQLLDGCRTVGLLSQDKQWKVCELAKVSWVDFMATLTTGSSGFVSAPSVSQVRAAVVKKFNSLVEGEKIASTLNDLGCFSTSENVWHLAPGQEQDETLVSNVEVFCQLLIRKLKFQDGERDLVLMQHSFDISEPASETTKAKLVEKKTSTLMCFGGEGDVRPRNRPSLGAGSGPLFGGYSAMSRTVGFPAAAAARCILQWRAQQLKNPSSSILSSVYGVKAPVNKEIYEPILELIKPYHINFKETTTKA